MLFRLVGAAPLSCKALDLVKEQDAWSFAAGVRLSLVKDGLQALCALSNPLRCHVGGRDHLQGQVQLTRQRLHDEGLAVAWVTIEQDAIWYVLPWRAPTQGLGRSVSELRLELAHAQDGGKAWVST